MDNPLNVLRAAVGFARVVRDPDRLGEVFQFIDNTVMSERFAGPVLQAFRETEEGARALVERPRTGRIDLDALSRFPEGSLGHAFATHMRSLGLDPDALPSRAAHNEMEWVSAHLYETHDIWHVVTGFGADRAGELGLQAFYLGQFPSRVAAGILTMGFANTLLFEFDDAERRMDAIVRGWVLGRRARRLLGVDWKSLWSVPLEEVRARFAIDVAGADAVVASLLRAGPVRSAREAVERAVMAEA
ncbi:MAG: Coq4 family protein [Minicystis sp.]